MYIYIHIYIYINILTACVTFQYTGCLISFIGFMIVVINKLCNIQSTGLKKHL